MTMAIGGMDWVRMIAPLAAESWIASLWQGMALAVGVWVCLKLIPRVSASTRFVVWSITFFTVTLLPLLRWIPMPSHVEEAPVLQPVATHFVFHLDPRWAVGIASVWLIAILFHAVRLIYDLRKLHLVHKAASPIAPEKLDSELRALLGEAHRNVRLCVSDTLDTPSAIGFFRPAVVLPCWLWEELSSAQIKQVVVHELAHLRRYDDWTNLLQKFIRMLMPINPALYWIEKHLCFEREMACDDAVLDAEITARDYATCLTTLAGKRLAQRAAVLAPGAVEKQSDLSKRVHSLLSRTRNSSLLVARGVAAGFLVVILGGAAAFTQCPQWVAFTSPAKLQVPVELQAAKLPEAKIEQASLRVPAAAPLKRSGSVKQRHFSVSHSSTPSNSPRQNKPVLAEVQQASSRSDNGMEHGQILIVQSVYQSDSSMQVQQTVLIFSEQHAASSSPSSKTAAKPVAQPRQEWLIFEI